MNTKELRILNSTADSREYWTRREVFHRFLGILAAALAGSNVAHAHPIHNHLSQPGRILDAAASVAAGDWSPQALNVHQNETLLVVSERILPGSAEVRVNRLIDLLLTVEIPANRQNFVDAVAAVDTEAKKRFNQLFVSLTAEQQEELLTACSTTKSAKPATAQDSDDIEDDRAPVSGATLRDHFENLKGWIVGAFYSTETGMRELGWTEETYFDALPECTHPDGHA
jgi:Gluconate 2-dehydrogenase subunit 3